MNLDTTHKKLDEEIPTARIPLRITDEIPIKSILHDPGYWGKNDLAEARIREYANRSIPRLP
ncbi:hypothetical protein AGMMS50256_17360 [Betaproteobacteria bacterium]|nr:hypothetical protein AGMMS50256_17360 [Betaproteobacteria bacterium]